MMQPYDAFARTYNCPEILSKTLRLIFSQSLPPECLIIIDNGDGERTKALVPELQWPQIIHVSTGDSLGPGLGASMGLSLVQKG